MPRASVMRYVMPAPNAFHQRSRSRATGLPLIAVMMSPTRIPALAAGCAGLVDCTIAVSVRKWFSGDEIENVCCLGRRRVLLAAVRSARALYLRRTRRCRPPATPLSMIGSAHA